MSFCPCLSAGEGPEHAGRAGAGTHEFGIWECVRPTECTLIWKGWHLWTWIELLPVITEPYFWVTLSGAPGMEPCGAVSGSTQGAAAAPAGQPRSSLSLSKQHTAIGPGKWHFNYIDFYFVNFIYENGTQTCGMMCIGFSFWKEAGCSFTPPRLHSVINLLQRASKNENGIWDSTYHTVCMLCKAYKSMKICFQLV